MSMMRAAAPVRRMPPTPVMRTDRLPPVVCRFINSATLRAPKSTGPESQPGIVISPRRYSRASAPFANAMSGGACSIRTSAQSASSSSASIIGNAVCAPCPISVCGTMTVTVLSGAILTQALSIVSPGLPAIPFARSTVEYVNSA